MRDLRKLITTATILASGLYFAAPVFAQNINLCPTNGGNLCSLTIPAVITGLIQFVLIVAFLLAFAFLVMGGIRWILSGGDKAGTEAAKGTITAALIGLIVVLVAWAILNLVKTFFGINFDLGSLAIPTITNPATNPNHGITP